LIARLGAKASLDSIKPMELTSYLTAKGWARAAARPGKGSVWLSNAEDLDANDVLVPESRRFADYKIRVEQALRSIATNEGRSEEEVLRDVQSSTFDLLRIRVDGPDTESGSLQLEAAAEFVSKSRDMLLAAACSTLDARAVYASNKPKAALNFTKGIKLGQTEVGSFVATPLSPVAPQLRPLQENLLEEVETPYERRVTETLIRSLQYLDLATREASISGDVSLFVESIPLGVSANLCDAVAGISSVTPGSIDITMSWASTRPSRHSDKSSIIFDSDSVPIILEAARRFRETAPINDIELKGVVTNLARTPDAREGAVTITAYVEGHVRNVVATLGRDLYGVAIRAQQTD
jgi:hypothetical protein